ncbi:hypothetical protein RT41_GL000777 [Lactococcus fujiensis JCM 16395]|uniref:Uncharacterized protein n=1 Tax=Lactococcus fujiensis JCM 16395 TaxID=1291764 RepID=A0A2A5RNQ8_9LACT|nr:hypothetical protein RT41_GL000777 [Lactococcus fujiensis JCM 16395]
MPDLFVFEKFLPAFSLNGNSMIHIFYDKFLRIELEEELFVPLIV